MIAYRIVEVEGNGAFYRTLDVARAQGARLAADRGRHRGREDSCLGAAALPERALLFDRPFSSRKRLEAVVRNRLAALDREPVGSRGQTLLGALQRGEPLAEVVREALVELVKVEIGSHGPRLLRALLFVVLHPPPMTEGALKLPSLHRE
jgi:hypothetical protein